MYYKITSHQYYIGLLFCLIGVFAVSPFFGQGSLERTLLSLALLLTLLFCVLVISHSKKLMMFAILLATPLIIQNLQSMLGRVVEINPIVGSLGGVAFIALIITVMLHDMFVSKKIDEALIVGSISLYFLLGLMWGFVYFAVEQIFPGSFYFDTIPAIEMENRTEIFIYYSMVTLTTLGYGDITPLLPQARAMSTMEAAMGQIYLTVLVARFVGKHISQSKE